MCSTVDVGVRWGGMGSREGDWERDWERDWEWGCAALWMNALLFRRPRARWGVSRSGFSVRPGRPAASLHGGHRTPVCKQQGTRRTATGARTRLR